MYPPITSINFVHTFPVAQAVELLDEQGAAALTGEGGLQDQQHGTVRF